MAKRTNGNAKGSIFVIRCRECGSSATLSKSCSYVVVKTVEDSATLSIDTEIDNENNIARPNTTSDARSFNSCVTANYLLHYTFN